MIKHKKTESIGDVILKLIGIVIFIGFMYICLTPHNFISSDNITTSLRKTSNKEKASDLEDENRELEIQIEDLQAEIYGLEEGLEDKGTELEELQREYEEAKDLIEILRDQLEEYGIEPNEL